jgi:S-DNA-T family DNA segregation ATPase FtsK/SpoIIIE
LAALQPHHPAHNFIGPIGAILGGFAYFMLGAAAYFVAVLLFGYGGCKLFSSRFRILPKSLWIALFILSGACLLELQPWFLNDWKSAFNIDGAGGWIGHWLGRVALGKSLGIVGSTILLLAVYLVSLILLTGMRPIHVLRQTRVAFVQWREERERIRLERADAQEKLELNRKKLEREKKRLEKELRKQGKAIPAVVDEEEPAPVLPEPKIFDATAPAAVVAKPKPKEEKLTPQTAPHFENYQLPELDLLDELDPASRQAADPEELRRIQNTLIDTLAQFGIMVSAGDITRGPTITRYEVYPAKGVRVDKIVNLERDLARATRAERINILAPIPGKDTVGIEIANSKKVKVTLRELLQTEEWVQSKARIPIALGKDVYGKTIVADLAQMPHCLVAGTTGSGKSVCINAMIASMLYRFTPEELRFVMIDPKVVEMQVYNTLPHLVVPVVTDPKKVLLALRWVIDEMEKRYKIFAATNVRNITSFNNRPGDKKKAEEPAEEEENQEGTTETPMLIRVPRDEDLIIPDRLPYIVVIIDELADLMQTAPADVESAIARITQMARAAGIHMIVATQTPRADVVTGVIKANIPSRVAFQVASKIDSRVILDENGADRLLGQGDMLYLPPGTSRLIRAQGVLVTDEEIREVVNFVSSQSQPAYENEIHERLQASSSRLDEDVSEEDEELVEKCMEIIRQEKRASTSLLQRRLRLGYTRAARVVDILEQRGILGPGEGAKPREILVDLDNYNLPVQ